MVRPLVIISYCLLFWTGCGSGSFVGSRFDNFTAYYNTFYNAEKSFEEGYESLRHKDDPIDREHYLPLFVRPTGNTANRSFDSAIRKSADVLRNHPESKWVDDALLVIGKSYFYQEAFVGALQKFREVIDLRTDLENEARFWLARTLITSGALDEALTELEESLAREGEPDEWVALFRLALGELYVKRSEWEQTAEALSSGLEKAKEKDLAGRAQFLLGQTYETMGRYAEAVEAFRRVGDFNPLYELSYAGKYSAIRVEGFYGDVDEAVKELRKMERDDKNYSYRLELTFLRGRILQRVGDADGAFDIYDRLLYDQEPNANIGALRGRVHYALGELYRDLDKDYVMASAHFDTASTSLSRPISAASATSFIRGEQFTAEAITDIDDLKTSFSAFARVFDNVSRMDSLLWLGRMSQEEFDEKVLEMRRARATRLEEQREQLAARQLEQQFRQGAATADAFAGRGLPEGKIIPTKNDPTGTNSGFLFHRNPARVEDGQTNFILKWGDRPLVPNWRRLEAVSRAGEQDPTNGENEAISIEHMGEDALPELDLSGIPRDSLAQATIESERALARYELGNTLFLAMERPDSAAVWYRMVIEENGDEPVAQRAYYALAEVQNALGDSLAADGLYRQILESDPDSDYSNSIRTHFGETVDEVLPDSAALAEIDYSLVYEKWGRDENEGLLDDMLLVAATYPGMDIQARALLATGEIHMEKTGRDTTALFAELPVTLPDSIIGLIWPEKLLPPESDEEAAAADSIDAGVNEGVDQDSTLVVEGAVTDSTQVRAGLDDVPTDSTRIRGGLDDVPTDSTRIRGAPDGLPTDSTQVRAGLDDVPVDSTRVQDPDEGVAEDTPTDSTQLLGMPEDSLSVIALEDSTGQVWLIDSPGVSVVDSLASALPVSAVDSTIFAPDSLTTVPDSSMALLAPGERAAVIDEGVEQEHIPEQEYLPPTVVIQDIFRKITQDFGGTPFGTRAQGILASLDEIRNPPQQSIPGPDSLSAMPDSLSLLPDSLSLSAERPLLSPDSLASTLDSLSPSPDSQGGARLRFAAGLDSLGLTQDSLSSTTDATRAALLNDILAVSRPDSAGGLVLDPLTAMKQLLADTSKANEEGGAVDSLSSAGSGSEEIPPVEPEPDDHLDAEHQESISTTLRPLLPDGRLSQQTEGWFVILESSPDIDAAGEALTGHEVNLGESEYELMIISGREAGELQFLVGWGVFSSKMEAFEAISEAGELIPPSYWYLRMVPTR